MKRRAESTPASLSAIQLETMFVDFGGQRPFLAPLAHLDKVHSWPGTHHSEQVAKAPVAEIHSWMFKAAIGALGAPGRMNMKTGTFVQSTDVSKPATVIPQQRANHPVLWRNTPKKLGVIWRSSSDGECRLKGSIRLRSFLVFLLAAAGTSAAQGAASPAGPPEMCFVAADANDAEYRRAITNTVPDACGFVAGTYLVKWLVPYNRGFPATCQLADALQLYALRLDAMAKRMLGTSIARIDQIGTYACRRAIGLNQDWPSEHARANAIDIAGFEMADGTNVLVKRDWGTDTPQGGFLAAARADACQIFQAVLTPNYNAAHAEHMHLDLGPDHMCR